MKQALCTRTAMNDNNIAKGQDKNAQDGSEPIVKVAGFARRFFAEEEKEDCTAEIEGNINSLRCIRVE